MYSYKYDSEFRIVNYDSMGYELIRGWLEIIREMERRRWDVEVVVIK